MDTTARPSAIERLGSLVRNHARVATWLGAGVASVVALLAASVATGGSAASVPSPTATTTTTATPSATASATATLTGTPTASPTGTATPTSEPIPLTNTPVPVAATPTAVARASVPSAPPAPTATPIPPPPPPPASTVGLSAIGMDAYSRALLDGTNARRAGVGVRSLRENGYLNAIAKLRSDEMAANDYFAHVSPITGENVFALMDRYGVPYGWAGENLAKNNYPDAECVAVAEQALWDSPSHHENIVNPEYTDVGIALTVDATGMKYFTIVFAGPP